MAEKRRRTVETIWPRARAWKEGNWWVVRIDLLMIMIRLEIQSVSQVSKYSLVVLPNSFCFAFAFAFTNILTKKGWIQTD